MAKLPEFSAPIMHRPAGLQTHEPRRNLGKELKQLTLAQTLPAADITRRADTMNLKDGLCDIQSDRNCWFCDSPPSSSAQTD